MATGKVIAISGGVGGAKLSLGLAAEIEPRDLTVVVNTGDDSWHYGLFVAPDIDTQLYSLSGRADTERGWGRRDESWNAMDALRELGEDVWFNLGDKDLGLNLLRTMRLNRGDRLTDITADFARHFDLDMAILPMCDQPVSTQIKCVDRDYEFHEWFVEARAAPRVTDVVFRGCESAAMTHEVAAAFADPDLTAIIICPSNPYLSISPILAVPGMADAIRNAKAPVVGISPVIGGKAVKGPTAAMMEGFGVPVVAASAAAVHHGLYDGYIIDERDLDDIDAFHAALPDVKVTTADTLMVDLQSKKRLARAALEFAWSL